MDGTKVDITALIGLHILTGADYGTESVKEEWGDYFRDVKAVRFTLDGITYQAVENPSDGYRSSMDYCIISGLAPINTFTGIQVLGTMYDTNIYYKRIGVIVFLDVANGLPVLEVGTDVSIDYYPRFVGTFYPQNMHVNTAKKDV